MAQSTTGELENIFQKFTQDFGLYSIAQIIPSLLGLVALMLFTRVFPPVAYGRYALAMTFVGVLSTLVFNWIRQSIIRFEPELDSNKLIGNVLSMLAVGAVFVVLATSIGYLLIGRFLGKYQPFYFAAAALIISQGMFNAFQSLFQSRLESGSLTKYKLILGVTKLVFAIILAVFVLDNIVGWMWGHVIASFLTVTLMARQSGVLQFTPQLQSTLLSRFARYGFPMIGWLLGMTLLQFADRILLESIRGTSAVGIYSPNYSLVQRGLVLAFSPLGQAAQPLMMNMWNGSNHGDVRDLMTNFTRYLLIIGVPATIFAGVMSRPLSTLLLAAQYHEGYLVILIVAPGLFLWNLALIGHTGFEIEERTRVLFAGISGAVVLNVVLNVPLIGMYGYLGAAVATLISFSSYAVFTYFASRKSIRWQLPTQTIRNTAVGGIAMAAPSAVLYLSGAYSVMRVFVTAGLGVVLYVAVLYAVDEFRTEEVSAIAGIIRER